MFAISLEYIRLQCYLILYDILKHKKSKLHLNYIKSYFILHYSVIRRSRPSGAKPMLLLRLQVARQQLPQQQQSSRHNNNIEHSCVSVTAATLKVITIVAVCAVAAQCLNNFSRAIIANGKEYFWFAIFSRPAVLVKAFHKIDQPIGLSMAQLNLSGRFTISWQQ